MNPTLIRAVIVVTFALIFYSIAVLIEQRKSAISHGCWFFLTAGLVLDISSTILTINRVAENTHHHPRFYRLFGFDCHDDRHNSGMAVLAQERDAQVPRGLNLYTRFAYGWWVIAYIAGAVIAMTLKKLAGRS